MARDKLKLQEAIKEAGQQQQRAGELKEEAKRHEEEVKNLGKVIAELRRGAAEVESEGITTAVEALESARDVEQRRLQELRRERDKLLEENSVMSQAVGRQKGRVERAEANTRAVAEAMKNEEAKEYVRRGLEGGFRRDLEDCAFAEALLKEARNKLEGWRF